MGVITKNAYYGTPPVVTNGLVYYNDAANKISYVGSGTTINDLSISNYPLILAPNVTYNSSYGGYLGFIGSNAFATGSSTPPTSLNNLTSATWTSWINVPSITAGAVLFKSDNNGVAGWFTYFGTTGGGGGTTNFNGFGFAIVNVTTDMIAAIPTGSYPIGSWFNATMVWDGNNISPTGSAIYINGSKISFSFSQSGVGSHAGTDAAQPLRICAGTAFGTNGASVNSSIQMIHNRALSEAEVVQNYNALKTRYGLT